MKPLLVALIAVTVLLSACKGGDKAAAAPAPAAPVLQLSAADVAVARRGALAQTVPLSGPLDALRRTTLGAQVEAEVKSVAVRAGDKVRAGQVLAVLDPATAREGVNQQAATLAANRARHDLARQKLERQRALAQQGFISALALDEAESEFRANRAELDAQAAALAKANKSLKDSTVRAPFDGVVYERLVEPGQAVSKNARLLSVADLSALELAGTVPGRDIGAIRVGQPARVTVEGRATPVVGSVVRINPVAASGTRSFTVFVRIDNRGGALLAGQFARADIEVAGATDAVILPRTAVREADSRPHVLVVAQGTVSRREVKPGLLDRGRDLMTVEGVKAGETVLYGHVLGVKPGDKVSLPPPAKTGA